MPNTSLKKKCAIRISGSTYIFFAFLRDEPLEPLCFCPELQSMKISQK